MSVAIDPAIAEAWATRLKTLGFAVQQVVFHLVTEMVSDLSEEVAEVCGETIYRIDQEVETVIEQEIQKWPDSCFPLLLIAEGMGHDGIQRLGESSQPLRYRLILDPIDGTRGLMYDKRSAWFLAAIAPELGEFTTLQDTFAAVMVELPTSKQRLCDAFSWHNSQDVLWERSCVGGGEPVRRTLTPSQQETLAGGFGQVTSFFQGTKVLAAELMERIAAKASGHGITNRNLVFDDQYISTGGQLVELMVGHDRFCCDLRPLLRRIQELRGGSQLPDAVCHPYDICSLRLAQAPGMIVTDGFGRLLNAPLNISCPVHWCGYGNRELQRKISPVIREWLTENGICCDEADAGLVV